MTGPKQPNDRTAGLPQPLYAELERMRKRLLDLSNRNPLLNYRHPKTSSLRVIDEIPSVIFERLASTSNGLLFEPLPAPSERDLEQLNIWDARPLPNSNDVDASAVETAQIRLGENELRTWAESLGINPSYELASRTHSAERRHRDNRLQSLFLPEDLEKRLRSIDRKVRDALSETGVNLLHLMLGFVEWLDTPLGDEQAVRRYSPLVLVPVTIKEEALDRKTNTRRYSISRSAEDWSTNVTLQEKCRQEFGFEIPLFAADDEDLEQYFTTIEGCLPNDWRLRRWITLGSVSFGKILMWRDLDAKNWPQNGLTDRHLFQRILGDESVGESGSGSGPGPLDQVYEIDVLPDPPSTVTEADSSQHSVLVDVQKGRSLVVEGPPGTGKSQTIVNLIANALLTGQRVLFVAEKFAALDVVYRRLRQARLAEFCLALHSQKPRAAFLHEMMEVMALRGRTPLPKRLDETVRQLNATRDSLGQYVARLHQPGGALNVSPFTVFWRARTLLDGLGPQVVRALENAIIPNPMAVTAADLAEGRWVMRRFGSALAAVRSESDPETGHPWLGVTATLSTQAAQGAVLQRARVARRTLDELESHRNELLRLLGTSIAEAPSALECAVKAFEAIGVYDDVSDDAVRSLWHAWDDRRLQFVVRHLEQVQAEWSAMPDGWRSPASFAGERLSVARRIIAACESICGTNATLAHLTTAVHRAVRLADQLDAIHTLTTDVANDLGVNPQLPLASQLALLSLVQSSDSLGPKAWSMRRTSIKVPQSAQILEEAAAFQKSLSIEETALEQLLPKALRPGRESLVRHVRALGSAPRFLPWLWSAEYRAAIRDHRAMRSDRKHERYVVQQDLLRLVRHLDIATSFCNSRPLRDVWGDTVTLDTPLEDAARVAAWYHQSQREIASLGNDALLEAVWSASDQRWQRATGRLSNHPLANSPLSTADAELAQLLSSTSEAIRPNPHKKQGREIAAFLREWPKVLKGGSQVLHTSRTEMGHVPFSSVNEMLRTWESAVQHEKALESDLLWLRGLGFTLEHARVELGSVRRTGELVSSLRTSSLPTAVQKWIAAQFHERHAALKSVLDSLGEPLHETLVALDDFAQIAQLDAAAWQAHARRATEVTFENLSSRFDRALRHEASLYRWSELHVARAAVEQGELLDIAKMAESGLIQPQQAADAYEAALLVGVARRMLDDPILHEAFGEKLDSTRVRFRELDNHVMELTRDLIRAHIVGRPRISGNYSHRVAELTEEALLEREAEKQRKFVPIRALFARAGRAIRNLKPCFLMSPFSVAQYIGREEPPFDLVIMDEASQMRPEDALGAIARARQLVVVGDTKQLPPTDFFQKAQLDDTSELEEAAIPEEAGVAIETVPGTGTVLQKGESILHVAHDIFPYRVLMWHYRSRHPKLIAFSNRAFYQDRLILFPAPVRHSGTTGVLFHSVQGMWESNTNALEAKAIVAAARAHAEELPDQSLMIVAMNREQTDLIDDLLTKLEKDDDVWASYRERWEHRADVDEQEPFVVKNLENVQGDERDRVMISVTYGPDRAGNLYQRFGPINADGGERRLNVLFTRARHRMDLYCSFEPEMLRVQHSSPRGLQVLQQYLLYAKDVAWAQGQDLGRDADSEFEIAVASALTLHGLEVKAQVGVAGYFVDLGIVHPDHPNRFLIGVECDGATYHSAKSARDRDRLKQQNLERLGWRIHRIWSTDWFRDRDGQVQRVLAVVADELSKTRHS